ncbi:hypothetical protein R5R35_007109 [Gryllus longicercus]|uniref:PHD finger protein 12 n=1 Tax=Gryllus longicercus TaxID=2509291 RepID=A0AAN9VJX2_9ORTH
MASVEYDLDTSGGLMPQIQALIAPPVSEDATKAKKKESKDLHPYYKRPGKGHNHDCCDACGEGGDLLCCDKCPASFHFQCHDPPLDEADLPIGEWLCHACRMEAAKNQETEQGSTKGDSRGRQRGVRRDAPEPSGGAPPEKRARRDPCVMGMEMLVQAAAALNPRQFDLPRELTMSLPFPGTDKHPGQARIPPRRGSVSVKKKPYELDNGLVPLPVRTCFECRRSCRKAPLVACDYCPLLFHQDCLDPPLTSLPSGLWMCPNHPEQFLDSSLLTSCSASERVRLWDRYSGPIDQDAIKVEFIRKAHRQNPPFRFKVRLPPRNTVRVPEAVKAHYAQPPPLVPSLRTVLREDEALVAAAAWRQSMASCSAPAATPAPAHWSGGDAGAGATAHEQAQWLSSVASLQQAGAAPPPPAPSPPPSGPPRGRARRRRRRGRAPDEEPGDQEEGEVEEEEEAGDEEAGEEEGERGPGALPNGHDDPAPDTAPAPAPPPAPTLNGELRWDQDAPHPVTRTVDKFGSSIAAAPILQPRPGCPLTSVVRPTPAARSSPTPLTPPPPPAPTSGPAPAPAPRKALAALATQLEALVGAEAVTGAGHPDERLVRLLALQRLQQLLSTPVSAPASGPAPAPLPPSAEACAAPPPPSLPLPPPPPPPRVRARALLCPLTGRGPPCAMSYRTLSVGTGADNDVVLMRYGHCNFVSAKHAAIFFDETTQHFELLNYSEHGTTVDNVLFSCDFSEKPPACAAGAAAAAGPGAGTAGGGAAAAARDRAASEALAAAVRAEVDQRRGRPRAPSPPPPPRMAPDSGKDLRRCGCRGSGSTLIGGGGGAGWEGTALLAHGSFVRFGCLQFVFSVTDHAPACSATAPPLPPPPPPRHSTPPLLTPAGPAHSSHTLAPAHLQP